MQEPDRNHPNYWLGTGINTNGGRSGGVGCGCLLIGLLVLVFVACWGPKVFYALRDVLFQ